MKSRWNVLSETIPDSTILISFVDFLNNRSRLSCMTHWRESLFNSWWTSSTSLSDPWDRFLDVRVRSTVCFLWVDRVSPVSWRRSGIFFMIRLKSRSRDNYEVFPSIFDFAVRRAVPRLGIANECDNQKIKQSILRWISLTLELQIFFRPR